MVDPARIIEQLNAAGVDYVVIGGIAATLHGCPEQTYDLDVLYNPTPENRKRLIQALTAIEAQWEHPLTETLLQSQPVFALNTRHGDLDIFTAVPGLPSFAELAQTSRLMELQGAPAKVLDLASLIRAKEAAADPNPRKQAALAFLKKLHNANRPK